LLSYLLPFSLAPPLNHDGRTGNEESKFLKRSKIKIKIKHKEFFKFLMLTSLKSHIQSLYNQKEKTPSWKKTKSTKCKKRNVTNKTT
jgi:hypothetical protein